MGVRRFIGVGSRVREMFVVVFGNEMCVWGLALRCLACFG